MVELIVSALPIAIVASTPLLLAVQGELVAQRAGMINLGVEGMLLGAALTAVVSAQMSGSVLVGFAGGIAGAALIALIFGVFTLALRADQIVTGTAINLLSLGVTSFAWRELRTHATFADATPPLVVDFVLPLAWIAIPIALGILLWNSHVGLRLRAAGENPDALTAAGASPAQHRWLALAIEALLVGIAGGYLALATANGFAENMSAGRGFIALAIVIFGRWKVKGALLGTAIFGIAAALQYALQASSQGMPYHLLLAIPYVVTLLILCGAAGRVKAPQALGK
jgi:general nucleoside transport system permease protein